MIVQAHKKQIQADGAAQPESPNAIQCRAADPAHSVWVGASAGTGKTKVLTDRVLRLLLPRDDGKPGTEAHRILCLTFTKAAAGEMRNRIGKRLAQWAATDEKSLRGDIGNLLGREPIDAEIAAARRLFASVVDAPGGLKIMTIHSFCQSVLGRFPLEADLPPHFEPLEDGAAKAMLARARGEVMARAHAEPETDIGTAFRKLAATAGEDILSGLIEDIVRERRQTQNIMEKHGGAKGFKSALARTLGVEDGTDAQGILGKACADGAFDAETLRRTAKILAEHGSPKKDGGAAQAILSWLALNHGGRIAAFPAYRAAFIKSDGEARADVPGKKVLAAFPETGRVFSVEAQRILDMEDRMKAAECADLTAALFLFGETVLARYEQIKYMHAGLDFDDLILRTMDLLKKDNMAGWVMYKLDGGIDHVLVDEAQDTNPEQWDTIAALCDDFFSGTGARDEAARTVFAVGDEKQSIYGFQRAAPEMFRKMRTYFSGRAEAAKAVLTQEAMITSFRSVPAVLRFVDTAFAPDAMRGGIDDLPLRHESARKDHAGRIEVWPLFETPDKDDSDPWAPPVAVRESRSGGARLAEHIGQTIKDWLDMDNGELLPARGRVIRPGDIMILVRSRSALVGQLIRALKTRNIPVGGLDRIALGRELAVQDLLAAAQFALLPSDDLTLACLLKSPFVGWDDARLEKIAARREFTLWDELAQNESYRNIVLWLRQLISLTKTAHPYEFFDYVLHGRCPGAADGRSGLHTLTERLGPEALDPVEELLNATMSFERDNMPSLQDFLIWMGRGESDIKREQEEAGGYVRVMTVHGAKGLQAPVVILPDTVRSSSSGNRDSRLYWPTKTQLPVPLWAPRKDAECRMFAEKRQAVGQMQDEEYRRLFYVALTRAEDRLYIGGCAGRGTANPESWYNYARAATEGINEMQSVPFASKFFPDAPPLLRFEENQKAAPKDQPATQKYETMPQAPLPDGAWLYTNAPEESALRILSPSRAAANTGEPAAASPGGSDAYRFRRGVVTHKLLQHLPDMPSGKRRGAAELFVAAHAADLPADTRKSIVNEVMAVIENPAFAPLFGPGSMAEVPLTGRTDDTVVSGQIDRLLVTDSEIWIVDYKSNRPPPKHAKDVSPAYKAQMKCYSDIVSKIYKNRKIRTFLLWTDGMRMMEIAL